MTRVIYSLSVVLLLNACSVVNFQNGSLSSSEPKAKVEHWHHNAAYSLWEVSSVVNPSEDCGSREWSMVTTKESFITGLAGGVDVLVGIDIWDPQSVEVSCVNRLTEAAPVVEAAPAVEAAPSVQILPLEETQAVDQ
jgi:hypothetical protein